tara:strand:+ start:781 stop:975 length:195 start_codon:yes stop_codon:yes gene_type:complete
MPKKRQHKLKDRKNVERDGPKQEDFSTKEEWKKQLAKRKENRDRNLRKERFRKTVDTISIYVDE